MTHVCSRAPAPQSPLLVVALVALILARSIDQTIFYRLAQVYSNYVWYLGAIILPVAFLIVSWPVVWWKMMFTGACGRAVCAGCECVASHAHVHRRPQLTPWRVAPGVAPAVSADDITPEMREFPHRKYLIMGALDTCFNLLSTW